MQGMREREPLPAPARQKPMLKGDLKECRGGICPHQEADVMSVMLCPHHRERSRCREREGAGTCQHIASRANASVLACVCQGVST
jgi:hypothetical protein